MVVWFLYSAYLFLNLYAVCLGFYINYPDFFIFFGFEL